MDDFIIPAIIDLITDCNKSVFSGIKGKIKLHRIKKELKHRIFVEILEKYGNEVFYNDLDHFLTDNDVICSIIRNCCDISVFQYKSKLQMIAYYVQLFVEQYPKHKRYHYKVRNIIQKYFEVIYNTLNQSKNDDVRIICNVTKELANELLFEIQDINKKLDHINENLEVKANEPEETTGKILINDYRKYLLCLYSSYLTVDYLERKIYSKDKSDAKFDALDALIDEKNILLLGEAGFGKTYEAITLLKKACTNENTRKLIPVFLPLQEYGLLYSDIISGIKHKLEPFCEGNIESLIRENLKNGYFLLILDGIDDITQNVNRTKFYNDIKNLSFQYTENYFFITSRFNRYHGELGEKQQYYLTGINEFTIRQELQKEGIFVKIPNHYYKLFSNPFFLTVGKSVLKQSANREIFNRSKLFEELFQKLYGEKSEHGGNNENIPLTYSEAICILGEFAYNTFYTPSYSYLGFDQHISKVTNSNKITIVNSFVSSGLFKIEDKIIFVHKLLKEYCVAYYLVSKFPLSENLGMYLELIQKDEWKEVFVFMGGIFNDLQLQDAFLDFVMEHNLPLYIECVNAKSDISQVDNSNNSKLLLTQLFKSYRFIINNYFNPIERLFDPIYPQDCSNIGQKKKVGIIGFLSDDKKQLIYWFDFVPQEDDDVKCLNEEELKDFYAEHKKSSILNRHIFSSYGINMQLSGLNEDSGRKIAIDLIKKRLKNIIENKGLIESKYLLCERVACYQKKIKELKNLDNLVEMQAIIDNKIDKARKESSNMMWYRYNGVELFSLRDLLHYLNQDNTVFTDNILPKEDMPFPSSSPCFVWDMYSKEQKEKRLAYFFYFHEISYLNMVESNFPKLKNYFSRFNDAPYQVIVEIDHNEKAIHDYSSEPIINYYYIASPTSMVSFPLIKLKSKKDFSDIDIVMQTVQESYLKQGREVNRLVVSTAGFTLATTSSRTGTNDPLAAYVYKSLKESLEDVFGAL